ncbi:extracellular calcium-sensing receptor-like [Thalassophryne amazonica]|uniref:extracellular calcium-sensing receptor-like n=1 Tax=Thalassophryne amazonica TaxID=390379 RepID=UPI00147115E9|nr:extracellular calcium-sensing receptor-like [Thalassophryne amazonica]
MAEMQRFLRWSTNRSIVSNCYIAGSSNHNQRIESWLAFLRSHHAQYWMNRFQELKDKDCFSGDFLDKQLILFTCLSIIQVIAVAQLLIHFNWTWVGLLREEHEYGLFALQGLLRELRGTVICVAFQETIPSQFNCKRGLEIIEVMHNSGSKVVVLFSPGVHVKPLLRDYMEQNITGIQWVTTTAWAKTSFCRAGVAKGSEYYPYLGGTIGFTIKKGHIPRMSDYLQTVNPDTYPNNPLVQDFWEYIYGCSPPSASGSLLPPCTGQELLLDQTYMDTSSLRTEYNVYKSVFAIAHSLHNLLLCQPSSGSFYNNSCAQSNNIQPWQLQHYLQEVAFSMAGEEVNFDLKGESVPYYDNIIWQRSTGGKIEFVTVGLFDGSKPAGEEMVIQEDRIIWAGHQSKVLVSVCSPSCLPGFRKSVRRGEPACCYDCVPCDSGKISNKTDSIECISCPQDFWSNKYGTSCIPKQVEFLTYDSLGLVLNVMALVGAFLTLSVFAVFFYLLTSPVPLSANMCTLQNNFEPSFIAEGDYVIGGIFPLHYDQEMPNLTSLTDLQISSAAVLSGDVEDASQAVLVETFQRFDVPMFGGLGSERRECIVYRSCASALKMVLDLRINVCLG